jgi:hypothetical protein
MSVERVRVFNQSFLPVSAEKAWAYLCDWAGTNRQRIGGLGELTLAKIELEGGIDDIPRTRAMEFGAFGVVRETLLYQNHEDRHLYYNMEGVGPHGIRNYLATTDIDEAGEERCQITIAARFDLDEGADVAKVKALIDFAHNQGVIRQIQRYYEGLK